MVGPRRDEKEKEEGAFHQHKDCLAVPYFLTGKRKKLLKPKITYRKQTAAATNYTIGGKKALLAEGNEGNLQGVLKRKASVGQNISSL